MLAGGGTITAGGGRGKGIQALVQETASGGVKIMSLGRIDTSAGRTSADGVLVDQRGDGDDSITVADVFSSASCSGESVRMRSTADGNLSVTTTGAVSGGKGIYIQDDDSHGVITVTVGVSVARTTASGAKAVAMAGGGSHKLVLRPGAGSFTGTVASDRAGGAPEI